MTMRGWWWFLLLAAALAGCGDDTSSTTDDGGGDAEPCDPTACDAACVAGGATAGVCRATGCECVGGGDADADGDDDADGEDDTGPATCELDFDCPPAHACVDGSCEPTGDDGVCFRAFERPPRKRQLNPNWTTDPAQTTILQGVTSCGDRCIAVAFTLCDSLTEASTRVLLIGEQSGSWEPETAGAFLAASSGPTGPLVAWVNSSELIVLAADGEALRPTATMRVSSLPIVRSSILQTHWSVCPGGLPHLLIDARESIIDILYDSTSGLSNAGAFSILDRRPGDVWRNDQTAVAHHCGTPPMVELVVDADGDGGLQRYSGENLGAGSPEELGYGLNPETCPGQRGTPAVAFRTWEEPLGFLLRVLDLPLDGPATEHPLSPVPLEERHFGPEYLYRLYALSCEHDALVFALVPDRWYGSPGWELYRTDGVTTETRTVPTTDSDGRLLAIESAGLGAAWYERCAGVRLVVTYADDFAAGSVLEYQEW